MKKTFLFLTVCTLLSAQLSAFCSSPNASGKWFKGLVILKSEEVVKGSVQYNHKFDLVQCNENGLIRTYSAQKVGLFVFYDEALQTERVFKSMPSQGRNGYTSLKFFEVLDFGELPLLGLLKYAGKKAKSKREDIYSEQQNQLTHEYDQKLIYEYYVLFQDVAVSMRRFEKEVLPHMKHRDAVKQYIADNHLDLEYTTHQLALVRFYNALEEHASSAKKEQPVVGR